MHQNVAFSEIKFQNFTTHPLVAFGASPSIPLMASASRFAATV